MNSPVQYIFAFRLNTRSFRSSKTQGFPIPFVRFKTNGVKQVPMPLILPKHPQKRGVGGLSLAISSGLSLNFLRKGPNPDQRFEILNCPQELDIVRSYAGQACRLPDLVEGGGLKYHPLKEARNMAVNSIGTSDSKIGFFKKKNLENPINPKVLSMNQVIDGILDALIPESQKRFIVFFVLPPSSHNIEKWLKRLPGYSYEHLAETTVINEFEYLALSHLGLELEITGAASWRVASDSQETQKKWKDFFKFSLTQAWGKAVGFGFSKTVGRLLMVRPLRPSKPTLKEALALFEWSPKLKKFEGRLDSKFQNIVLEPVKRRWQPFTEIEHLRLSLTAVIFKQLRPSWKSNFKGSLLTSQGLFPALEIQGKKVDFFGMASVPGPKELEEWQPSLGKRNRQVNFLLAGSIISLQRVQILLAAILLLPSIGGKPSDVIVNTILWARHRWTFEITNNLHAVRIWSDSIIIAGRPVPETWKTGGVGQFSVKSKWDQGVFIDKNCFIFTSGSLQNGNYRGKLVLGNTHSGWAEYGILPLAYNSKLESWEPCLGPVLPISRIPLDQLAEYFARFYDLNPDECREGRILGLSFFPVEHDPLVSLSATRHRKITFFNGVGLNSEVSKPSKVNLLETIRDLVDSKDRGRNSLSHAITSGADWIMKGNELGSAYVKEPFTYKLKLYNTLMVQKFLKVLCTPATSKRVRKNKGKKK